MSLDHSSTSGRDNQDRRSWSTEVRGTLFAMKISQTRARKLINDGGTTYLATMVMEPVELPALEDILIVREYPNVFLKELFGIPP